MRQSERISPRRSAHDALFLSLLTTTFTAAALIGFVVSQRIAQRPAADGVMTVSMNQFGDLRLWNQPITPHDLPILLRNGAARSQAEGQLIVRLIPAPELPWGLVRAMVDQLQPSTHSNRWSLQLQLP